MTFWPEQNSEQVFEPQVHPLAYVAPSAVVSGRVQLGENSSIWPGSVLRADINKIVVGKYSNIQDLSVCHVENETACVVGNYVTVGHRVILHACTVEDDVLVGMGTVVMNRAHIGKGTIIGAGSLITEGKELEPGAVYVGRPARKVRMLTSEELARNRYWAEKYAALAEAHRQGKFRTFNS